MQLHMSLQDHVDANDYGSWEHTRGVQSVTELSTT